MGEIKTIERKTFINNYVEVKGVNRVYVSTEEIDRDGEKILKEAWSKRLKHFMSHPVLLSSHNYSQLTSQIGIVKDIGIDEKGLWIVPEYFDKKGNFEADWAKFLYDHKLAAFSVGFIPYDWDNDENGVRVYKDVELVEISQVLTPSLREAVQGDALKNIQILKSFIKDVETKGVIPFEETPKADEKTNWDGNGARRRLSEWAGGPDKDNINWEKYGRGFAWVDNEKKENFSGYKLPHHDVIGNRLKVVWRGVVAAMGSLLGARGGVDIPEKDKKGVYEHLAKHYKQFNQEPPEFKDYSEEELKEIFNLREVDDEIFEEELPEDEYIEKDLFWLIRETSEKLQDLNEVIKTFLMLKEKISKDDIKEGSKDCSKNCSKDGSTDHSMGGSMEGSKESKLLKILKSIKKEDI